MKLPVVVPFVVLPVFVAVVGFVVVFQTIPLTVIVLPPLEVIVPPLVAVVTAIALAAVVDKLANVAAVVNVISLP